MSKRKEARENLNRALLSAAQNPIGLIADRSRRNVVAAIDMLIEAVIDEHVGRPMDEGEHARILDDLVGSPGGD